MHKKTQAFSEEKTDSASDFKNEARSISHRKGAGNLNRLQSQIFEKVAYYSKTDHFLSSQDLKRMMPNKKHEIESAVTRLQNLGFIKTARTEGTFHHCPFSKLEQLRGQKNAIVAGLRIERMILRKVRLAVQRIYPEALLTNSETLTGLDKSRHFDIVFEFKSPILDRQFLAVDVYTKIPVTDYIVRSFARKIRWTRTLTPSNDEDAENSRYLLRDRTLGIIVCNKANRKAVDAALEYGISLLSFSDLYIDYDTMYKKIALAA